MSNGADIDRLRELELALGHIFTDRELLREALTHKSYTNERGGEGARDNERLEFLGDAVLSFLVSRKLLDLFPRYAEGELSRVRAALVDEEALSTLARQLRIGDYLALGRGEELTGGRDKKSILADAFEALLAAVYLDGGLQPALRLIDTLFDPLLHAPLALGRRDYKTELQERAQASLGRSPRYVLKESSGPDHDRRFVVEVHVGDMPMGTGVGRSKKEAEQAAARIALQDMEQVGNQ